MAGGRPLPPASLFDVQNWRTTCVPAPELAAWAKATFIDPDGSLANEDHAHLQMADVAFLWTSVSNTRQQRRILGQAELGEPRGTMGKWPKARAEQQLVEWFDGVPTFLITIDAHYAAACADAEFCALIEHELYHCAPERDEFGAPKFTQDGRPKFAMRGHDVEEFVGIVRRYGSDAAGVRELIEVARHRPEVAVASIARACGTCLMKAA